MRPTPENGVSGQPEASGCPTKVASRLSPVFSRRHRRRLRSLSAMADPSLTPQNDEIVLGIHHQSPEITAAGKRYVVRIVSRGRPTTRSALAGFLGSSQSLVLIGVAAVYAALLGAGQMFFPGSYKVAVVRTDAGFLGGREKVARKLGRTRDLQEALALAAAAEADLRQGRSSTGSLS